MKTLRTLSVLALTLMWLPSIQAEETAPAVAPAPTFATVNDKIVSQQEFHAAFASYLRQKFYHGQVPEGQLEEARKEVRDRLVARILLLDEARRRGLAPDDKRIEQTLAEYDARYGNSPMWQENRQKMLPGLRQQLAEQDLLQQMEDIGHTIPDPTEQAIRDYYQAHPELFTEPEKLRLHTILLKVDPSSPKVVWDTAREEAARIVVRLRAGQNSFEELAGLHSNDSSAEKGGDMGYLHLGMIPAAVQEVIDGAKLGTITDPIDVLEGVAIFRPDDRIASRLMPYEGVAPRARELFLREQREQAWLSFVGNLRKSASITFHDAPASPATPRKD